MQYFGSSISYNNWNVHFKTDRNVFVNTVNHDLVQLSFRNIWQWLMQGICNEFINLLAVARPFLYKDFYEIGLSSHISFLASIPQERLNLKPKHLKFISW